MRQLKTVSFALVGSLLMLGAIGCDSKQEKATKEMISVMNDYADRITKIKSNTDYVDAKKDLEKLNARMKDAVNAMSKVSSGTSPDETKKFMEEQKKLQEKLGPEMERAMARVMDQVNRISKDVSQEVGMQILGMGEGDMKMPGMNKPPTGPRFR